MPVPRLLYPSLTAFFPYYGSKGGASRHYPKPKYDTIIEPFAGSACYSLRYPGKNVKLYDISPVICGVWEYLIRSSEEEILALPLEFESTDELKVCQEAKWFIGFAVNPGSSSPALRKSSRCKSFNGQYQTKNTWGGSFRDRIATQLQYIRHWTIENCSYENIPEQRATWFIDPPYQGADGLHYPHKIDNYLKLSLWCKQQKGQVIVCDQSGATYLPFRELKSFRKRDRRGEGQCHEVVWYNEN